MTAVTCRYLSADEQPQDSWPPGLRTMQFVMNKEEVQSSVVVAPEKKPNETTRKAIKELEEGGGAEFKSIRALFEDLGI